MLQNLSETFTEKEIALHKKAVAKLRAQLFRKYTQEDYFIIPGTEKTLAPTLSCKHFSDNSQSRDLALGGLKYLSQIPAHELMTWEVSHTRNNVFSFYVSKDGTMKYTLFSTNPTFEFVDEHIIKAFNDLRLTRAY